MKKTKYPIIIEIWRLSFKNRIRAILGLTLKDINYWGKTKTKKD